MNQLTAFARKEWMEQVRCGRFWMLLMLFSIFGILSPALAKMTPWLYEMLSGAIEEQGIIVKHIKVTALFSWQQYYKNISLMLIAMTVIFSNVLTGEYQRGTLVHMLTKGLPRWKVIAAKAGVQLFIWTLCYWMAFAITYGYTVYFWDNSIASHWLLAGAFVYLLGIWLMALIYLGSVLFNSNMGVLLFTGGAVAGCYLAGIVPYVSKYLPIRLLEAGNLLNGASLPDDFKEACIITAGSGLCLFLLSIVIFNKKRI